MIYKNRPKIKDISHANQKTQVFFLDGNLVALFVLVMLHPRKHTLLPYAFILTFSLITKYVFKMHSHMFFRLLRLKVHSFSLLSTPYRNLHPQRNPWRYLHVQI